MIWIILTLSLVGLALALLLVAESLRPEPFWRRPETSASPRQRRWIGICLVFVMTGTIINTLNMAGRTEQGLLAFALPVLGLVAIVIGLVRGPTDQERERRERLLRREAADSP